MNETTSKTRQWELLKILTSNDPKHKNGYAIDELSKRMGVSPRTIQRDLHVMSDILKTGKIVLECRPVPSSGKQLWKIDFLSGESTVNLHYDEAIALCIGYQFLQPLIGTPIWKSASAGIKKIRSQLGKDVIDKFDAMAKSAFITHVGSSNYQSNEYTSILDDIYSAMESQCSVVIKYRSQESTRAESYSIDPYHIMLHKGSIYIIGYSHKVNAMRHWKLNRVEQTELLYNVKFNKDPSFNIGKYMSGSFGVIHFPTEKLQKVKIRFDESVARYVSEHVWSNSQKLTTQPDGSVILELKLNNTVEVKNWVMSFGSHAEVLKPSYLRDEIVADLQAALKKYEQ